MYTSMLVWNPEGADDAVFERLRRHLNDDQIVELGYFVALTYGQQRWIKTLGIGHGEVLDMGDAGLTSKGARVAKSEPAREAAPVAKGHASLAREGAQR